MLNLTRRQYCRECSDHLKNTKVVGWVMICFALAGIVQNVAPWTDIGLAFVEKIPKIPIAWALIVFLCGMLVVVIEGGYRRSIVIQTTHQQEIKTMRDAHESEATTLQEALRSSGPQLVLGWKYGSIALTGPEFYVSNVEGEPAYNIRLQSVQVHNEGFEWKPIPCLKKGEDRFTEGAMPGASLKSMLTAMSYTDDPDMFEPITQKLIVTCNDAEPKRLFTFSFTMTYKSCSEPAQIEILPTGKKVSLLEGYAASGSAC